MLDNERTPDQNLRLPDQNFQLPGVFQQKRKAGTLYSNDWLMRAKQLLGGGADGKIRANGAICMKKLVAGCCRVSKLNSVSFLDPQLPHHAQAG